MCAICGCSTHDHEAPDAHDHEHDHGRDHAHPHEHGEARRVRLEHDLLAKNDRVAERCRGWLEGRGVVAWNLISSPGAGKTTLLERTLRDLGESTVISVIEGDQETARDAERIRAAGGRALQINTGRGCHLDAAMILKALPELDPPARSVVMIENVGNLVCPALFDLGERAKVVIVSVAEGEDKPLKYPHAFRAAEVMILSKVDLLPHLDFDVERCLGFAREVNPRLRILPLSARTGAGLADWYAWLTGETRSGQPRREAPR